LILPTTAVAPRPDLHTTIEAAMTILLSTGIWPVEDWLRPLAKLAPGRRVVVAGGDDYDPAEVRYALVWKPPVGLLAGLPNLAAIFSLGAGVDHILADPTLPAAPLARIVDPDLTMRMTEWVVLQVLFHHRQTFGYMRLQAEKRWAEFRQPAAAEVRVGVMGLGVLGRDAVEVIARLGFDTAGWSRSAQEIPGVACFHGNEGFDAFLARTDILVCLLPLTPETQGLIDRRLLSKLPRDGALGGAVLINAGRGGQQVAADVLAALDDGTLVGASLDVFETEPLPEDSPFWSHPKVLVYPHVAAASDANALARLILRQIERVETGLPPEHLVDRVRGY
jgi:glyoxylate/hydroxypyruvate reductase A